MSNFTTSTSFPSAPVVGQMVMHNGTAYYNKPVLEYMLVSEQYPSATVPPTGAGINNARIQRVLNTLDFNNITGASLNTGTNQITLPAGTYEIDGEVSSGLDTNFGQRVVFFNVSTATVAIKSLGAMLDAGHAANQAARLHGVITIASPTLFGVFQYLRSGASNSLGYAVGESGVAELYSRIHIFKRY
jgi:hypothetical protein